MTGCGGAAAEIHDRYLARRQGEAMMKVAAELIDEVALVGPRGRIRERLSLWQNSPISTLNVMPMGSDPIATLQAIMEMVG